MLRRALWTAVVLAAGCRGPNAEPDSVTLSPAPEGAAAAASPGVNPRLLRRFKQVANQRQAPPSTPELVGLGRTLWFDTRLSSSGDLSCNTCHELARYGVDGKATSVGFGRQRGRRNTPTVYNAAEHFVMFWDGAAPDVETQAARTIQSPTEMAMRGEAAVEVLRGLPGYVDAFGRAFPGDATPISMPNIGRALGAFERGLTTRSRWDDYLAGDEHALTDQEISGLRTFLNLGCMGCHTGPQMGASMFQVAGFALPWPNQADLGRFELTKIPTDRMVFKVPSLKNVAQTAPYFHDGSVATLPEAVRVMGRHQLGIDLSDAEVASIVTFLGALTGELPRDYIRRSSLPAGAKAEAGRDR
jgi:cytochrome c peroxidase